MSANNKSTLFLGDLSAFCSEQDIYNFFVPYGEITEIKIMRSEETHRNLSYGFIKFANPACAKRALNGLDGVLFCGRHLRIGWASYKSKKEPKLPQHHDRLDSSSVHVSYISYQLKNLITEESLRILFSTFGVVLDTSIKKSYIDESINRQCGYGFVHFSSSPEGIESALAAVAGLNDATIEEICYKCSISHNLEKQLSDLHNQSRKDPHFDAFNAALKSMKASHPMPAFNQFPTPCPPNARVSNQPMNRYETCPPPMPHQSAKSGNGSFPTFLQDRSGSCFPSDDFFFNNTNTQRDNSDLASDIYDPLASAPRTSRLNLASKQPSNNNMNNNNGCNFLPYDNSDLHSAKTSTSASSLQSNNFGFSNFSLSPTDNSCVTSNSTMMGGDCCQLGSLNYKPATSFFDDLLCSNEECYPMTKMQTHKSIESNGKNRFPGMLSSMAEPFAMMEDRPVNNYFNMSN